MSNDVAASIRARLYNKSKQSGVEFQLLLARYACERFLYRLGMSPVRDRCILKGATLLAVWMQEPYRGTRDVDLLALGRNDETSVREIMTAICTVACPEDGLNFDLGSLRVSPIRPGQAYQGQRVKLVCHLGQARIPTQIDFGFGDVVTPGPQEAKLQTLIEGLPAPTLRVYPLVTSIAEKLDAMVQLGQRNSRMKDFHDVWAISESFAFNGGRIARGDPELFRAARHDLDFAHPGSPNLGVLLHPRTRQPVGALSAREGIPDTTARGVRRHRGTHTGVLCTRS